VNRSAARIAERLLEVQSRPAAIAVLLDAPFLDPAAIIDALRQSVSHAADGNAPEAVKFVKLCTLLTLAVTGPHNPEVPVEVYGEIGAAYRLRNRPDLARVFYERALQNTKTAEEKASVRISLGILHLQEGNLTAADQLFVRAQQILEKEGITGRSLLNALINRASIAKLSGRAEEASHFLKQAVSLSQEEPDLSAQAQLMLGSIALEDGNFDMAREYLDSVDCSTLDWDGLAFLHTAREQIYQQSADAEQQLKALLAAVQSLAANPQSGTLEDLLSSSQVPLKLLVKGIADMVAAGTSEATTQWEPIVLLLHDLALARGDLGALAETTILLTGPLRAGDQQQCISWLEEALSRYVGVNSPQLQFARCHLYLILGQIYIERRSADREEAIRAAIGAWESALNAANRIKEDELELGWLLAQLNYSIGTAYKQLVVLNGAQFQDTALEYLQRAKELLPPGAEHDQLRQLIDNNLANAIALQPPDIGSWWESGGRSPDAIRHSVEMQTSLLAEGDQDPERRCILAVNIAQGYLELSRFDASTSAGTSLESAGASVAQAAAELKLMSPAPPKLVFAVSVMEAILALEQKLAPDALISYRARLQTMMAEAAFPSAPADLISAAFSTSAKIAALLGEPARAYRTLLRGIRLLQSEQFHSSRPTLANRLVEYLIEWDEADRALHFLNRFLLRPDQEAPLIPLRRRWYAPAGQTILVWLFGHASHIFVVDASGVQVRTVDLHPRRAFNFSGRWLDVVANHESSPAGDSSAEQQWQEAVGSFPPAVGETFFRPVADLLPATGLLSLVLDPFIKALPVHLAALECPDGVTRYLKDQLAIDYRQAFQFSATAPLAVQQGVFVASYSPPHARLPFAVLEAHAVALAYGPNTKVAIGDAATPEVVLDALSEAGVAHLSCHGVYDWSRPLDSVLYFAGQPLTLREIQLRLADSPCRLLVLSACSVGMDLGVSLDEPAGFPTVLLSSGCESVIAAAWRVDDLATALLMACLHHHLAQREEPATALASAQKWLGSQSGPFLADLASPWVDACRSNLLPDEIKYIEEHLLALRDHSAPQPFSNPVYWGAFFVTASPVTLSPTAPPEPRSVICPNCKQKIYPDTVLIDYYANLGISGFRLPCPRCGNPYIYDCATAEALPDLRE